MPLLISWLLAGLSLAAIGYTLFATWAVGRLRRTPPALPGALPSVTLLKPLHGGEPRLGENLASFAEQDYPAPVQMLSGVADRHDPAAATARAVGAEVIVTGLRRRGANGKISNLLGMMPRAGHEVLVLSDSDMSVPPDYLATLVRELGQPGVGAVTCLYRGRGDAGAWSTLAAAQISYHFLPSVMVGLAVNGARPCMGSTIAFRRDTLAAIGGFERFVDVLADDYEMGEAIRRRGLDVTVSSLVLTHGCADASLAAMLQHELRWAATIRLLTPVGYATTIVTHPLPLALIAAAMIGGAGWGLPVAAMLARLLLGVRIDRLVGARSAPAWLLPLRDLISGALYVAGFFVRRVEWRGEHLDVAADGTMQLESSAA